MENESQKLDVALELARQVSDEAMYDDEETVAGGSMAGFDEAENSWRVIVKYYGDINSLVSGIDGVKVTVLFNQYAVVTVPASKLDVLAGIEGIVYIEKPREVYYNVNIGREASCINSVQGNIMTGGYGLTGKGVLVGIIDSGERVIIMSG